VKKVIEESLLLKIDDSCAQKLLQLSRSINKPIKKLVLEYEVFSMNENFKSITLQAMEKFVRKMTPNKTAKPVKRKAEQQLLKLESPGGGRPKTDTLMATYGVKAKTLTPMQSRRPFKHATPVRTPHNLPRHGSFATPNPSPLTPATIKFEGRLKHGQVVASLSGNNPISQDIVDSCGRDVNVEFYNPPGGIFDKLLKDGKFRYMFMDCDSIRRATSERITMLGEVMKSRVQKQELGVMDIGEEEQEVGGDFFSPVDIPGNGVVHVLGRILYERLPDESHRYILEGDLKFSGGNRVKLDISVVDKCAIFPGQTVVVKGVNTSGHEMVAQTIYDDFSEPKEYSGDISSLKTKWIGPISQNPQSKPVIVLAAFGPFTNTNTFEYEGSPLQSFAMVVAKKKPAVLIMLGPLIDIKNPAVHTLDVTFKDAAVKLLNSFFKECCQPGIAMEILIAPSIRDAHHEPVFPQPPYFGFDNVETPDPELQTVELMCNPAQFTINDYSFAVSSYDVLLPLNRQLTYINRTEPRKQTKLELICEHPIKQKSFYPALTGPLLDRTFSKDLYLHKTPDIFLTSTNLKYFAIQTKQGTAILNSRTLARGNGGGAYSQILIHPPQDGKTKHDRLLADIVKI